MSIERLDSIEELRLATDFKYYCKWSGVDPIHWKDYILTPQHIKLIEWLMSGWDMVSVAYRWFGKSSLITNKYASWRATQHQKTISIFSATEDLACDKLRILKSSCVHNCSCIINMFFLFSKLDLSIDLPFLNLS